MRHDLQHHSVSTHRGLMVDIHLLVLAENINQLWMKF